jgi:hypothetical protein
MRAALIYEQWTMERDRAIAVLSAPQSSNGGHEFLGRDAYLPVPA